MALEMGDQRNAEIPPGSESPSKTVEEALKHAREEFDVGGLADLDFEILTQPRSP